MRVLPPSLVALAARQSGVLSAAQLAQAGAATAWTSRQVTAGRWRRLHRGVLVIHSGPVPWRARAWAALLYAGDGAALSHETAAHIHEMTTTEPGVITVSIPETRRVMPTAGVLVVRRSPMPSAWGRPRTVDRADTAVDLVAASATADSAIGWLCAAVRARTRPEEIRRSAAARPHLRHRRLLDDLLADVVSGIESPLERRYRRDVEAAHGLPKSHLQVRQVVDGVGLRADCVYESLGVRAELDGRLAHPARKVDADVWRDNAVAAARGELTLRYRWHHVAVMPCDTARQVGLALARRGWQGLLRPCSPTCAATAPSRARSSEG